tara:strand:+ start:61 stop:801 length:741 start_codon:yes stop_codon:yes gene_type:complete
MKLKKKYGQHFLINDLISADIASSIKKKTAILEIGPGGGALTKELIKVAKNIKVIEIDRDLNSVLNERFPGLEIINEDFINYELTKTGWKKFSICGNFPYNISTQILFKIVENNNLVHEVVGMFQKQVAERICSGPGSKKYGIPSVVVQAFYDCEILFDVSNDNFKPKPNVLSSVIRLTRNKKKLNCKYDDFLRIVKVSFSKRRKKIKNALKNFTKLNEVKDELILKKRAEELTVNDYVILTNRLL